MYIRSCILFIDSISFAEMPVLAAEKGKYSQLADRVLFSKAYFMAYIFVILVNFILIVWVCNTPDCQLEHAKANKFIIVISDVGEKEIHNESTLVVRNSRFFCQPCFRDRDRTSNNFSEKGMGMKVVGLLF